MSEIHKPLYLHDARQHSESALAAAAEAARRAGVRLTVAEVVEDGDEVVDLILEERRAGLETVAELVRDAGIDVELLQLDGELVTALTEAIARHEFDLIVKTADPAIDAALVRRLPAPVWVVRPDAVGVSRVLAAVEPFAWDADHALNHSVLDRAAAIARLWQAELHVVSTWTPGGLAAFAGERRLSVLEAEARQAQRGVLDRTPSISVPPGRLHVAGGSAADAVTAVARREGADLIVVGTAAREGLSRLLVGNTAERILNRADCSVLVVRGDAVEQVEAEVESAA